MGWKDLGCNLFALGLSQTVGIAESLQGQATSVSPDSLTSMGRLPSSIIICHKWPLKFLSELKFNTMKN